MRIGRTLPKSKPKPKPTDELHFPLLENGLDFVDFGLQFLKGTPSSQQLKYVILHLAGGAELILKERLRREHWTLVFDRPDQASASRYEKGDFKSVTIEDSLSRLRNISKLDLENIDQPLRNLRDRRNRFQHFEFQDTRAGVMAAAAKATSAILDFITEHLENQTLSPREELLVASIRRKLAKCTSFVEQRWKQIRKQLEKTTSPITICTSCSKEAGLVDDGVTCLFCRQNTSANEAADAYLERRTGTTEYSMQKDGGTWPKHQCPDCDMDTLVEYHRTEACKYDLICFTCSETWEFHELDPCIQCDRYWKSEEEGATICDDCMSAARGD